MCKFVVSSFLHALKHIHILNELKVIIHICLIIATYFAMLLAEQYFPTLEAIAPFVF